MTTSQPRPPSTCGNYTDIWHVKETVKTAVVKRIIAANAVASCCDRDAGWPAADANACMEFVTAVSDCVSQHAAGKAGLEA